MSSIQTGRVLIGGMTAGLIICIVESIMNTAVLGAAMEEALKERNLPPFSGTAIAGMVLWCFALGIVTVWLYAAIRPRFGQGAKTAAIAGFAVWLLVYFFAGIPQILMGLFPLHLMLLSFLYGLFEFVVGAIAGARLYREG
jgi:hypothetical protein